MNDVRGFSDLAIKEARGIGIRDHKRGDILSAVLIDTPAKIIQVRITVDGLDLDNVALPPKRLPGRRLAHVERRLGHAREAAPRRRRAASSS